MAAPRYRDGGRSVLPRGLALGLVEEGHQVRGALLVEFAFEGGTEPPGAQFRPELAEGNQVGPCFGHPEAQSDPERPRMEPDRLVTVTPGAMEDPEVAVRSRHAGLV